MLDVWIKFVQFQGMLLARRKLGTQAAMLSHAHVAWIGWWQGLCRPVRACVTTICQDLVPAISVAVHSARKQLPTGVRDTEAVRWLRRATQLLQHRLPR